MGQWWGEWQLRILVLASLSAQYFLVLFAGVRKFHIPPWLRFSFRLAHVGSDALAIFALATLFNRQKNGPGCSYARGSRESELLWAPILLMHLGGQVVITTYKIEDNEQWKGHILKSLPKVTVALYVFYKSWSSDDKRLLAATILLFILVTIRCFQKSLDLKSSSFNALRKSSSSVVSSVIGENDDSVREEKHFEKFMYRARRMVSKPPGIGGPPSLPFQLFLDIPCSYSDRLTMLRKFWSLDYESSHHAIEHGLSAMTSFLYTKDYSTPYLAFKNAPAALIFRRCTQVLAYATVITAICLVHTSTSSGHKDEAADSGVTLVLLYGTLLLELVYLWVQSAFRDKFSGRILQHNLIGFTHSSRHSTTLRSIAGWLQCNSLLDGFWHMKPSYSCEEITKLVHQHVESWWKGHITDTRSYRLFNDIRGERTLARMGFHRSLVWSIQRPFDESVIIWHLATDFLFHHADNAYHPNLLQSARKCKEMSNYMIHLLHDNPEMLLPGSRRSLLAMARGELKVLVEGEKIPCDEEEFTRLVFQKCNLLESSSGQNKNHIIGHASGLAKSLLSVSKTTMFYPDTRMWELIQGVWVEMLCFSAGRCRGYLHAETLGTGVEYLSYVWVLLAYTGMETFPEKLQRREDHSVDGDEYLEREDYHMYHPFQRPGSIGPLSQKNERKDLIIPPLAEITTHHLLQRREEYSVDGDEYLEIHMTGDYHTHLSSPECCRPLFKEKKGEDLIIPPRAKNTTPPFASPRARWRSF